MKTIGIRDLKTRLSSFIEGVKKGESILVKDHAEEVAFIVPLSVEYKVIRRMARYGKAQWSFERPQGLTVRVQVTGSPMSATVLSERQ